MKKKSINTQHILIRIRLDAIGKARGEAEEAANREQGS